MWRSSDIASSFIAICLATIVISLSEARANESGNKVNKRQVVWDRGYGGYGGWGYGGYGNNNGYVYNSWNAGATAGATGYSGTNVPLWGSTTGGVYSGIVGTHRGYGTNTWDGNIGNQQVITYPNAIISPRYGYGYGYGNTYGHYLPYGHGNYGHVIYPSPSSQTSSPCNNCGGTPPPTPAVSTSRATHAPRTSPRPNRYQKTTTTTTTTTTSTAAPVSSTTTIATTEAPVQTTVPSPSYSFYRPANQLIWSHISDQLAAEYMRSRIIGH